MRALLDVNVLIALFDTEHIHHRSASAWFADHGRQGWATCPLTQNGCIRVLSQASYLNNTSPRVVAEILMDAIETPQHEFWPDSISSLDSGTLDWDKLLTGRHLADAYLLALAVRNSGRLVTFDRGIPIQAVHGATSARLVTLTDNQ